MAESANPSTVRVSRGSMIPSSSSRPDRNLAVDSASICASIISFMAASASSS